MALLAQREPRSFHSSRNEVQSRPNFRHACVRYYRTILSSAQRASAPRRRQLTIKVVPLTVVASSRALDDAPIDGGAVGCSALHSCVTLSSPHDCRANAGSNCTDGMQSVQQMLPSSRCPRAAAAWLPRTLEGPAEFSNIRPPKRPSQRPPPDPDTHTARSAPTLNVTVTSDRSVWFADLLSPYAVRTGCCLQRNCCAQSARGRVPGPARLWLGAAKDCDWLDRGFGRRMQARPLRAASGGAPPPSSIVRMQHF